MSFDIGDEVFHHCYGAGVVKGWQTGFIAVEFKTPDKFSFHRCGGLTKPHYGFWVLPEALQKVSKETEYVYLVYKKVDLCGVRLVKIFDSLEKARAFIKERKESTRDKKEYTFTRNKLF